MRKPILIQRVIIVLAMMACATPSGGETAPCRTVARGALSGITRARQEVIKDKTGWEKTWAQHSRNEGARGKIPEIDFTKEMVVLVTMGQKNTGGYAIDIVQVEAADKRLKISVSRKSPPRGAMVTQALTAPFHFVAVPKSDLRPEFVEAKSPPKDTP